MTHYFTREDAESLLPAISVVLRNEQEIYLCWYLGEERIAFWHYLHTGFADHQPLDE
jgi:hypothetical protein